MTPPDQYVYAITDGNQLSPVTSTYINANGDTKQVTTQQQQLTKVKAKIRNTTPNEDIGNGTLVAVAEYAVIPFYKGYPATTTDASNFPDTIKDVPYSYSVSKPIPISSLSSTQTVEFSFDFSDKPIPAGVIDLSVNFVFKGTIGNEKDIAIAVASKDFTEPIHQTLWNLTDRFSLDYVLYRSDDIKSSPTLKYLVDLNSNGEYNEINTTPPEPYIDPYLMWFEIGYSGTNPPPPSYKPSATVNNLLGGNYIRLLVLVDEPTNYIINKVTDNIGGTVNQKTYAWTFDGTYDGVYTFRGVKSYFSDGILRCLPLAINQATGKPFCPYNGSESLTDNVTQVSATIDY